MKKVLLGMSGGVDSSAAAAILLEKGYDVTGVTLRLDRNGADLSSGAKKVCNLLKIPHITLEFFDDFERDVVDYFANSYRSGETPNPCIVCNRLIKFGALLEYSKNNGYDYISTGHYADIEEKDGRFLIRRPKASRKEQTYVLYRLTQEQLSHVIFPLSTMEKEEIRKIAKKYNMPCASNPDSQDICFIPDGDYAKFIERYTNQKSESGDFVDLQGNVLGKHRGIIHYTIGQRKGLGVSFGEPRYVISKDAQSGNVVLGNEDALFSRELKVYDSNWIIEKPTKPFRAFAKTRYSQKEQPALITPLDNNEIHILFDEPQRAITPGQSAVIYDENDYLLGGGVILNTDLK